MRAVAVIPARYASKRFPGKLLKELGGLSVIRRTVQQARRAERLDDVVVATDDHRIAVPLEHADVPVIMTSADHVSGTDRIVEAVRDLEADLVVNVQGDEPFIDPGLIDLLVDRMREVDAPKMGTARTPITDPAELEDPSVVKVVAGEGGRALYFSRCPIPFSRDTPAEERIGDGVYFRHLGLYAYRRDFLETWPDLPSTPLEEIEKLEQLRALAAGASIAVVDADPQPPGIDTPADLEAAERMLERRYGDGA